MVHKGMEDGAGARVGGDLDRRRNARLVGESFPRSSRSSRSADSNLDRRLRLDHRKGGREWDYESEISGPQLTPREEPWPDTSVSGGEGAGNVTWWNILLVHPCISPSISLIKRSLLDNFQPRPSLSFIFCSSHFLFPPPHHPPFSSIFVQSSPTACLLHDSGHVLTVRRTNTKQPGSFQNPPFDLV